MNATKKAQIALGVIAAGMMFFSVDPEGGRTQVVPVIDSTNLGVNTKNGITQDANMINAYLRQAVQVANQVTRIQQEVSELTKAKAMFNSPTSLSTFASQAVNLNNSNPLYLAPTLASSIIAGQNGALTAGNLTSIQSEALGAIGNLTGHTAATDASVLVASALGQANLLKAGEINNNYFDYMTQRIHRPQMYDIAGSVIYNGGNGGFTVTNYGIRDYSQDAAGSVF